MQPDPFSTTELCNAIDGIDARSRRRPRCRHHSHGTATRTPIGIDRLDKGVEAHPELPIGLDPANVLQAEAQGHGGFVTRGMGLIAGVDDQLGDVGPTRQSQVPDLQIRLPMARCRQGQHGADRGRVVDMASEVVRQSQHLP